MDSKNQLEIAASDWPENYSERDLPEISIGGTTFLVDGSYMELREKDDPSNIIHFFEMKHEDGFYSFRYNQLGKCLTNSSLLGDHKVHLLQMVEMDPKGVAGRCGVAEKDLPPLDSEIKPNPNWIDRRIKFGHLPTIRIVDQDYFIDLRMGEIRNTKDWSNRINLNSCESWAGDKIHFFYNFKEKCKVDLPPNLDSMPRNTVAVELPAVEWLDPVGIGRVRTGNELEYVDRYPPRPHHTAKIYPLEKCGVVERISANNLLKPISTMQNDQNGRKNRPNRRLRH